LKKNIKEILAPMSTKDKVLYIWTYYRIPIIGIIMTSVLLISIINSVLEKKEVVLNITMLGERVDSNGVILLEKQLVNSVVKDKSKEKVTIQNLKYEKESLHEASRMGLQKVAADITAGFIDILIIDKEIFDELSKGQQLRPLSNITGINLLGIVNHTPYYSSDEKIYGIGISKIDLLSSVDFDGEKVLCIPANAKNVKSISEFFTVILK
jgi:hypothetical protein